MCYTDIQAGKPHIHLRFRGISTEMPADVHRNTASEFNKNKTEKSTSTAQHLLNVQGPGFELHVTKWVKGLDHLGLTHTIEEEKLTPSSHAADGRSRLQEFPEREQYGKMGAPKWSSQSPRKACQPDRG